MRATLMTVVASLALTACANHDDGGDDVAIPVCDPEAPLAVNAETGMCFSDFAQCSGKGLDDAVPCQTSCTPLDEVACVQTAGCRAGYTGDPDGTQEVFFQCWALPRAKPSNDLACTELAALACARRDDCAAHYADLGNGTKRFSTCEVEPAINTLRAR